MPNFENIEQYESVDAKSGDRRILPIAPHSTHPVEYRPNHNRPAARPTVKAPKGLAKVTIEPVSIEQMEREFKLAARAAGDPIGPVSTTIANLKSGLRRLRRWLRTKLRRKRAAKPSGKLTVRRRPSERPSGPRDGTKDGAESRSARPSGHGRNDKSRRRRPEGGNRRRNDGGGGRSPKPTEGRRTPKPERTPKAEAANPAPKGADAAASERNDRPPRKRRRNRGPRPDANNSTPHNRPPKPQRPQSSQDN